MVTVKIEGVVEMDVVEGEYVYMDSDATLFVNWDKIPKETQRKLLVLRDTIKKDTQAVAELMTTELSGYIDRSSPSE